MSEQPESQRGPDTAHGGSPLVDTVGTAKVARAPVEETVDLGDGRAALETVGEGLRPGPAGAYPFLEPPREAEEIGWLAHYRIRRPIGSGGMGLVFLADDTHLERPVALKVMRPELAASPEAAARFSREARAAAAIKHDHIVTIYQVGQAGGVAFLAMEYLEGISLQRWLERGKSPSIDLVLRIGREVAAGLAAAHSAGLIHRDIKPGNIWLEAPNARAKILDFGQARAEEEDVQITQAGSIMGTPAFMSPEQAVGEPASASSDLFSLGSVLYRLCCGRPPFPGKTVLAVLKALGSDTPPPPREINAEVPEELDALVMRLLAKDPGERPGSAQDVVDALRSLERQRAKRRQSAETSMTESLPRSAAAPGTTRTALPTKRWWGIGRFGRVIAGALVLVLALSVAAWRGLTSKPGENAPAPPTVKPGGEDVAAKASGEAPEATPTTPEPAADRQTERAPEPVTPARHTPQKPVESVAQTGTEAPAPQPMAPSSREVRPTTAATAVESVSPKTPLVIDWGVFVDPDGDCRLLVDERDRVATLQVPNRAHLLSAEHARMNAPRTLRPVAGDFQAQVEVSGADDIKGRATSKLYPPYHGGGLLLWQDAGNYVRLEIASEVVKGKPRHYVNFEYRQGGRLAVSRGLPAEAGSARLRLLRRGEAIGASFSHDGARWLPFPALNVSLGDAVRLGIVGINSASKPMLLVFKELNVSVPEKATGDAPR